MNRESGAPSVNFSDRFRRTAGLTTTALTAVLALGACDDDPSPPFEVTGTGSVEGFLFLDADDDGLFDPSDGDEGLAGVGVAAVVRNTDDVLGSTVSGPDGRFVVDDLPAGSHQLLFDEQTVPDGTFVCQNPVPTTVFIGETTFEDVAARNACLVTIETVQQEAQEGDFVIVEGIVTSFPGEFDESDGAIQDETGGIWLFDGSIEGAGLQNGDLVEVGGTVTLAIQSLQLTGVEIRSVVPGVGVPDPVEVTTGEIFAASDPRDPLQNRLATVRAAELLTPFDAGGNRNANIDDGSGPTIIRVESGISDSGDAILATLGMTVGNCYDVTGIVGAFFGDAEIFPRSVDDVVEVPCG